MIEEGSWGCQRWTGQQCWNQYVEPWNQAAQPRYCCPQKLKEQSGSKILFTQKTFLFNKTKNSEMQFRMELQKSKGLSAAKNSTNSSEIMNRNETIVFIDPI